MIDLIVILILIWSIGGVIVGVLWAEDGLFNGVSYVKFIISIFICGPIAWVVMSFRALYNVFGNWLRS